MVTVNLHLVRSVTCYSLAVRQRPGIYVEILIRGDIDELWTYTQQPELHESWDLRFTKIEYLPRTSDSEPQRFNYTTRIGFGLQIIGQGESTGSREEATGRRTSALKFWSADPKSLIEEGSGYWQYIPTEGGVRFLTWYGYQTRFGAVGRALDSILFRPMIGWATAWSFDRLRMRLEEGLDPRLTFRLSAIHATSRVAVALIWLWQGLVPKLLFNHADERAMMAASHLNVGLLPIVGLLEITIAACAILTWRRRTFFLFNIFAMVAALAHVAFVAPSYLVAAFNPVTLNVAMIALSLIGYVAAAEIPSASCCLRQPPMESP
jgi:DoxX-like family